MRISVWSSDVCSSDLRWLSTTSVPELSCMLAPPWRGADRGRPRLPTGLPGQYSRSGVETRPANRGTAVITEGDLLAGHETGRPPALRSNHRTRAAGAAGQRANDPPAELRARRLGHRPRDGAAGNPAAPGAADDPRPPELELARTRHARRWEE